MLQLQLLSCPWSESVIRPNLCTLWNWWTSKRKLVSSLWNVENLHWFKLIYNRKNKILSGDFWDISLLPLGSTGCKKSAVSCQLGNITSSSTVQNPHCFEALCWFLTMLIIFEDECKGCLLPLTTPCFPLKLDSPGSVSLPSQVPLPGEFRSKTSSHNQDQRWWIAQVSSMLSVWQTVQSLLRPLRY